MNLERLWQLRLGPHISEKSACWRGQQQLHVQGRSGCDQAGNQGCGRADL